MASARGIALSTAVKIGRGIDLPISTRVKQWRRVPQWSTIKCRSIHSIKDRVSTKTRRDLREIGYTDAADLLSTPERDFLVKNNGQKVPVSSLKGKVVGVYFCENIPHPPRMEAIKKVYEEAKSRCYDFEIVQITLHCPCFNGKQQCSEGTWLTLPFMDPSCGKIQHVFECVDDGDGYWFGDRLVLIHPCQADAGDSSGVPFEFSGAGILKRWGIEGYPFTRQSLYEDEYELQKREITLQSLFPPGESLFQRRPAGDGFDLVDALSQLSGKRVLVLFAPHYYILDNINARDGNFASMLKCVYEAQVEDNVAEESKLEVVYASTDINFSVSSFDEFTKDMPWLVLPLSSKSNRNLSSTVFKTYAMDPAAVAFNEQGELVAKEYDLSEKKVGDKFRFPFIDPDLEKIIREEVKEMCDTSEYEEPSYSTDLC